ncbi:hypothetical protein HCJ92_20060, partial [Streptomyces sp. ventii]|nr:hypothetical protein [Streptomyces spiramenti]
GLLRGRRARVAVAGRGAADRPRHAELWLPGPDGTVSAVDPAVVPAAVDPATGSPAPAAPVDPRPAGPRPAPAVPLRAVG